MKDLFVMDKKDYDSAAIVFSRPSVRGIIVNAGKVLLIHSTKYDYYKFPGGGPEGGEDHKTALIREVREESGYIVKPDSISEFGRVMRRHKDDFCENGVFEQENFYYFCDVEATTAERKLDDYEAEEGFTPVWMDPLDASIHNRYHMRNGKDPEMVEREMRVLDLVDLELRRRKRAEHEKATLDSLNISGCHEMLKFVEEQLGEENTEDISAKVDIDYSRFEHTKRVLGWAKRLYDMTSDKENLRYEDLIIATIFHDVGRVVASKQHVSHALAGAPITSRYLLDKGYDPERVKYICYLVAHHSDKGIMGKPDADRNLVMLMEADLLDDMGAQGIVMDCMITQTRNPMAHFTDCLDHIRRFTARIQEDNPMVTLEGRKLWDEKTRLVKDFVDALSTDVEL